MHLFGELKLEKDTIKREFRIFKELRFSAGLNLQIII